MIVKKKSLLGKIICLRKIGLILVHAKYIILAVFELFLILAQKNQPVLCTIFTILLTL